ncbi:MAG: ABC transporter ATP-binding protein [Microbacteriaceae bacterium]
MHPSTSSSNSRGEAPRLQPVCAPALRAEHLTVSFERTEVRSASRAVALNDVSLDISAGEVVSLLGPSGSGKSTLLRAVCGLERLDAGSVSWKGEDMTSTPVHKRGFALMFQDGQLFTHRSVAKNIAYPLHIARVPAAATASRVAELLELVGLSGFGDRAVTTLSGGEQQRVALARALAARPQLLLLDEPLSSLDRELRHRLAGQLRHIVGSESTTTLFVTHDQDEAWAVSDRVGIMMAGQIVQIGTPVEVRSAPATAAISRFLGL